MDAPAGSRVSDDSSPHPLLGLQAVDSAADALSAERAALPQRAALVECDAEQATSAAEAAALRERGDALAGEQAELEREVSSAVEEGRQVEDKLYSGAVKVVAELEGLQSQLDAVRAKQAELEERQLERMEQQDALEAELAACAERSADCDRRRAELLGSLAEAEDEIDARLAERATEREAAAALVAPTALQAYDRLRKSTRLRGVVTAQLSGDACGSCRIPVPVMHVTRVRQDAADDVVRCENCGRILVV